MIVKYFIIFVWFLILLQQIFILLFLFFRYLIKKSIPFCVISSGYFFDQNLYVLYGIKNVYLWYISAYLGRIY